VTEAKITRGVESFIVKIVIEEERSLNVFVLLTWSLMGVKKDVMREASDCFYTSYGLLLPEHAVLANLQFETESLLGDDPTRKDVTIGQSACEQLL
jgi:hypothetical protein